MKKFKITACIIGMLLAGSASFYVSRQVEIYNTEACIATVNGGNKEYINQRISNETQMGIHVVSFVVTAVLTYCLFSLLTSKNKNEK